ncbi:hypothetical protein HMPREF0653_00003 [Prevotella disiens JCM 6334 = ATCC 29426]|nr:hypothetical protein HMPREF0653_00003 [Prevotella disiens JCM 6334 = ATCC 29426]
MIICILHFFFKKVREFGIRKALKKLVISLIICTFIGDNQQVTNKDKAMITKDKVTEIFCIIDEFNRNLNSELENNLFLPTNNGKGKRYRNRKGRLSESEIMTILVCYHFGTYRNFKEYYLNCIRGQLKQEFPDAVSYNRFVELMPRVFFRMMMFMKLYAFGKCTGITFVDSTMIPVCHNVRRYSTKYLQVSRRMGKVLWVGVTASNCICSVMTQERL